jgi:hypothetical protein
VDSNGLKKWQVEIIGAALRPALGYLSRLQRRMEVRGFPPQDPLYQLVLQAYQAMHHLGMELHYSTCNGVFRPTPAAPNSEDTPAPHQPPVGPVDPKN